jgi:hypothetical protein
MSGVGNNTRNVHIPATHTHTPQRAVYLLLLALLSPPVVLKSGPLSLRFCVGGIYSSPALSCTVHANCHQHTQKDKCRAHLRRQLALRSGCGLCVPGSCLCNGRNRCGHCLPGTAARCSCQRKWVRGGYVRGVLTCSESSMSTIPLLWTHMADQCWSDGLNISSGKC